jgi:hypothetical protein
MRKDFKMDKHHPSHVSRWFSLTGMIAFFLAWGLFLQAFDNENREITKEGKNVEIKKTDSKPIAAVPPIDMSAPSKTETATFSLG